MCFVVVVTVSLLFNGVCWLSASCVEFLCALVVCVLLCAFVGVVVLVCLSCFALRLYVVCFVCFVCGCGLLFVCLFARVFDVCLFLWGVVWFFVLVWGCVFWVWLLCDCVLLCCCAAFFFIYFLCVCVVLLLLFVCAV